MGESAAKAVMGVAPQLGQKAWAATWPSLRTEAFFVGNLKTAPLRRSRDRAGHSCPASCHHSSKSLLRDQITHDRLPQ